MTALAMGALRSRAGVVRQPVKSFLRASLSPLMKVRHRAYQEGAYLVAARKLPTVLDLLVSSMLLGSDAIRGRTEAIERFDHIEIAHAHAQANARLAVEQDRPFAFEDAC